MRFMVMHKVNKDIETGKVDPALVASMGKLIGDSIKAGIFQNGAGLTPAAPRTRMVFRGGDCVVRHGPYKGTNELLAGFAMIKVRSRDEAMEWARRFARVVGDVELELGVVTEPWELGLAPKPTGEVPMRFLMLTMADKHTEADTPPSEREQQKMGALLEEMQKAGVLLAAEGVRPSALGTRLHFKGGKRTAIVDGPFAESKEMISGFSLIQVPSREDALAWADQYGAILGDVEVDVLRLHDAAAF